MVYHDSWYKGYSLSYQERHAGDHIVPYSGNREVGTSIQLALPFSLLIPSRIHSPWVGATHIQTYLKHLHRPTQRCVSHGIPNSVKLIMKINQHKLFWGTNLFHYVSQESLQFRSLLPQLLKSTLHTTHCCHLCGETNTLFLSTQTYLRSSRQIFFGEKYFISTIFVV